MTQLPTAASPATLKTLAANLDLTFGIDIPEHDLGRLHTIRDVLQCVRLRRWEDRVMGAPTLRPEATPHAARPVFVAPTRDPRERFIRFTRQTTSLPPAFAPTRPSKRA